MIFKNVGSSLNKSTKTKIWWVKLGVSLVLSNIFFFILFSRSETTEVTSRVPEGWVEINVRAELLTPFHSGKKVLLVQRNARKSIEAMLDSSPQAQEGHFTVLVKESEAEALLSYESWEIVPFLKTLTFAPNKTGELHEIRY